MGVFCGIFSWLVATEVATPHAHAWAEGYLFSIPKSEVFYVHIPTKHRKGYPNIGRVITTSEGLLQQNKRFLDPILRVCARGNTKKRQEHPFYPSNCPVLATCPIFALTHAIYPPIGGCFGASGLWPLGPKSGEGVTYSLVPAGSLSELSST